MVTAGAASVYPTARDMARYVAALLGGGANVHGSVLKLATLATMFEPHYQPDPRVPGMGLGFWRGNAGGHLVEHTGILSGFNSQDLHGSRRWSRRHGLHQWGQPCNVVAGG